MLPLALPAPEQHQPALGPQYYQQRQHLAQLLATMHMRLSPTPPPMAVSSTPLQLRRTAEIAPAALGQQQQQQPVFQGPTCASPEPQALTRQASTTAAAAAAASAIASGAAAYCTVPGRSQEDDAAGVAISATLAAVAAAAAAADAADRVQVSTVLAAAARSLSIRRS